MNQKRCFFMGHRDAPAEVAPLIAQAVEEHIVCYGVKEFLVGNRGSFDRLAVQAVLKAKEKYPQVQLVLLLSYHPGERKANLPKGFDSSLYPVGQEFVPKRLAIIRANNYAVQHSAYLISYAWQPGSNARKLLAYAQQRAGRRLLRVTNLVENDGSAKGIDMG